MDIRPIGVFDSGVGGLTVVSQIIKELKNEEIVYFGDTARVPYGSKSKETVIKFSKQDVRFLLSKNVKAIVIACNTSSANSLRELEATFDVPIFGVVIPGAEEAARVTKNGKIGVIATSGTIKSGAYERNILRKNSDVNVFSKACPLFVPLAEEGWVNDEISTLTAKKYIDELIEKDIDTIVMGCTHYPLLRECIQNVVGEKVQLVDPAYETASVLKNYLEENDLRREEVEPPVHHFFVSDKTDTFEIICSKAMNCEFSAVEIDIEKY